MKRRFGLDRLFSKLDETTKAEAALVILAMNASLRLVCWLALFFRPLPSSFLYVVFSAGPKLKTKLTFVHRNDIISRVNTGREYAAGDADDIFREGSRDNE